MVRLRLIAIGEPESDLDLLPSRLFVIGDPESDPDLLRSRRFTVGEPEPDLDFVRSRLFVTGEPESLLAALFDLLETALPTDPAGDALPDLGLPDRADLGLPECFERGVAGVFERDLDLELPELADRERAAFGLPFSEPDGLAERLDFGLPDRERLGRV